MMSGWLWLALAIVATAAGQLVYKRASVQGSLPLTVAAVAVFCVAPVAAFAALHSLSLATVYLSTAASQLLVVLGSMAFFRERYTPRQWFGFAAILAGVLVFNAGSAP